MPKKDAKNAPKTQKIIVPKGTINPTDDTIIEIPAGLYSQPIVIAKKKEGFNRSLPTVLDEPSGAGCKSHCSTAEQSRADVSSPLNSSAPADFSYLRPAQDLDETEHAEKEIVLKQLEEFQRARRKFLMDTSAVANKSSTGNISMNQSGMELREKNVRWDSSGTQTAPPLVPPPIPPRRIIMKDSVELARDQNVSLRPLKPLKVERKRSRHRSDSDSSCSKSCKNLGSRESSEIDLNERIEEEELSDSGSDDEYGSFSPALNSTFTVKKRKKRSKSDTGSDEPPPEAKNRHRRHGDKSKPRKKKSMEKIPSKASRVSEAISTTDSCPETNCAHGSKKNDGSCAPCCVTKLPSKVSSRRSKSMMTDSDFEKIKDQLREARKKLDEAVAMVSRTVSSSSSAFSAGRMTSETDASPSPSYNAARTSKKPSFEPTKFHNFQYCPLRDMTNMMSAYNRSKNTIESALCLDSCSSVQMPPCVSKEALKGRPEQQQSFFRRTIDLNPSTTTCTPMLPCDIPSITSRQEVPPPSSAKSLPTSSTKIDEGQRRINFDRAFTDFSAPKDERYRRPMEKDDRKSNIVCATKQARSGFNALCSTMCLNMDPPPCTIEETLKKRTEELQNSVRALSASANLSSVPCTPMLPCDMIPAASKQNMNRPPSTSMKSLPTSTRITPERNELTSKADVDSGYVRFNKNIDRKRMNMCKASQTDALDPLCSNMCLNTPIPPCVSKEVLKEDLDQNSPQRIVQPNQSPVPCVPLYPCEILSATSRHDVNRSPAKSAKNFPFSSTKTEEFIRGVNIERINVGSKSNEDESYQRFKENYGKQTDIVCGLNDASSSKFNDSRSTTFSNIDPSSCTLEEDLRKESRKVKDALDRLPSAVVVPCKPMFPCEISSVASGKDIDRPPPPWSSKSLPSSSTRINETLQRNSSSSRTNDNSGYKRFRDDIDVDGTQAEKKFTSSRIHGSDIDDTFIVNPLPYTSQEAPTMAIGTQQSSHKPSAKSSSLVVPCTPIFPCDIPSIMSREKVIRSATESENERDRSTRSKDLQVWSDEDDEGRKPVVQIPLTKTIILGSKTNAGKDDSFSKQAVAASHSKNEFSFKTNSDKNSGYKPDQSVKNKSVIGQDGRFVSNQSQMVKTILKSTSEECTNDSMSKPRDVEKKVSKTNRVVFQNK